MKNILRAILLLAVAGSASAIEPPPVLLIVHGNIGMKTHPNTSGLLMLGISAWANSSVNKQSAVKVARFNTALNGMDLLTEASQILGCVQAGESCTDRAAFTDAAQFESALAARPEKDGVVVELTTELIAEQMLMRAVSHAVVLADKKDGKSKKPALEERAGYVAVATMRAPKDIVGLKKTDPKALEQYWVEGEPRRIVTDARHGLNELKALFEMLARDGSADGKMPEAWKQLPKVKEFYDSGRVACSGMAWCASTFVLKDNGDSFTLVSSGATAGWIDSAAAAHYSNLPAYAMLGLPWK